MQNHYQQFRQYHTLRRRPDYSRISCTCAMSVRNISYVVTQIATTLESMSIRYRTDTFASDRYLIYTDPMVVSIRAVVLYHKNLVGVMKCRRFSHYCKITLHSLGALYFSGGCKRYILSLLKLSARESGIEAATNWLLCYAFSSIKIIVI